MSGSEEVVGDLLRRGRTARVDGDEDGARAAYAKAFEIARGQRDAEAMGQAALGLAAGYVSGTQFGRVPAFLFEAHNLAEGRTRTLLAVALARAWVYSGSAERAVVFAAEGIEGAESSGDPELLAAALDAQLLVHWGPDDLEERLRITSRLEDTVAHLADPEARMSAHLWRMTTAMEMLDMPTVRRQLRGLRNLADETGSARVRFFSEARNGMHALVVGDLDAARRHREAAIAAGTAAGEADVVAIDHALGSRIAVQSDDRAAIAAEAEMFERSARELAHKTVAAEGIPLWLAAGELDRARSQLRQVAGPGLGSIPRDGDWILVVTCLTQSAAATGERALAAEGYALLEPYAGRGVANGGAAVFNGVVDGYLALAAAASGRAGEADRWASGAADLAERFGALWWQRRYAALGGTATAVPGRRDSAAPRVVLLRPGSGGVWTVGFADAPAALREMKGFRYLRLLVRQPGVDISALALSDRAAGHSGAGVIEPAAGEVIDRRALAAYRARLTEIDADLDEASLAGDAGRLGRLRDERDALLAEVRAATGLAGRMRQVGGSAERARVAVRKAVAAAIDRLTDIDAGLGRLLRDSVHTGTRCVYEPDPDRPVTWLTD